jgi:hypothetical protein
MGCVTAWRDVERAEPEFAQRVRALFDAHRHKTLATLRADGSPRISGIEAAFGDGELVLGSMPNARKGADLRRDPRFALHSATVDPVEGSEAQWPGEAKISGRLIAAGPVTGGPDGDRFHADIAEVVHTHLNEKATMLVVEWWTPARGLRMRGSVSDVLEIGGQALFEGVRAAKALEPRRDLGVVQVGIVATAGADELECVGVAALDLAVREAERLAPQPRRAAVARLARRREGHDAPGVAAQP